MNQIKCPKCGEVFTIDESSYLDIVTQIKNSEFEKELEEKLHRELEHLSEKKDAESKILVNEMKAENDSLKTKLDNADQEKNLALNELKLKYSEEISEKISEIEALKAKYNEQQNLEEMKIKLARKEIEEDSNKTISELNKKLADLQNEMANLKNSNELNLAHQKESYELQLKQKQTEVDYFRDLKTKLSTKLVGETLEQHCQNEFNRIRMTAFPNAYFEKDNDSKTGSKGDFIFRETDSSGAEILSIMFEMKNENDTTATKHKNEDFLKELDKDRNEKHCEYAVLVSMLEADNDYYNGGIVDVSYIYEKMYVVRPQCFLSIIGILRNAALNSLSYKRDLITIKNQNLDITNFEDKLIDFQTKFSKNFELAKDRFDTAIEEIDKTITHLQKVKDNLTSTSNQLRLANDKAQDLSIKKLTRGNETMKSLFEEAKNNNKGE